ncbi:MAG TPA: hypothetical protein VKA26_15130 [Ignavibacteriaceae bacterium]|nr:hypothetical protein [Ignavibacteriaceae bacterium]
MNYNDIRTIEEGIHKLKNDEHIKTAIDLDIVGKIFIISYTASEDSPLSYEIRNYNIEVQKALMNKLPLPEKPNRPFTYPNAKIYMVENLCSVGCDKKPHDDDCEIPHFNQAVESVMLDDKLDIISNMTPQIVSNRKFKQKYILDIDLDYFHTCRSIQPTDSTTFYDIIKNSETITISKEEEFVLEWANTYKYDEKLSVEYLMDSLLNHIKIETM